MAKVSKKMKINNNNEIINKWRKYEIIIEIIMNVINEINKISNNKKIIKKKKKKKKKIIRK